jgi:hypothetical protein
VLGSLTGAEASDEAAVTEAVETLRKGLLEPDRAKLDTIAAPQISYGHSDGRVETKEQFIQAVMTRKQVSLLAERPRPSGRYLACYDAAPDAVPGGCT